MSLSVFNDQQWKILDALLDTAIPSVEPSEIGLSNSGPAAVFAKTSAKDIPGLHEYIAKSLSELPDAPRKKLMLLMFILAHRSTAFALTGTYKLFSELTLAERTKLLQFYRDSVLVTHNQIYKSFVDLAMLSFSITPIIFEAYNLKYPNPVLTPIIELPLWTAPIRQLSSLTRQTIEVDVVVLGSGSSGGVVARRLAKQGFKVLILEKGSQISPSDCQGPSFTLESSAYEAGNRCCSTDSQIMTFAGSTLGGGAAVNWSCSLKTPTGVRKQWAERGAEWFDSPVYDEAMDHVWDVMGVTTDMVGPHSFTNDLILEGSKKLNYPAMACAQNTGKHPSNNHFLGYGYRYGEKGGVVNWLKDAVDAGAEIIDNARVLKIVHTNGKASGVHALVNGNIHLYVKAKRVAVCAGSLLTPGLLMRSGFRNPNIGRGLKLHPVTVAYGDFDQIVNKQDDPIMTAVCTEAANIDGNSFGARIEAIHHQPHVINKFLPWYDGKSFKSLMARYEHLSSILVIIRDRGGQGRVYLDKNEPDPMRVCFDYETSPFDLESIKQGCITAANLLYIQGAKRIFLGNSSIPILDCSNAPEKRRLADPELKAWTKKVQNLTFRTFVTSLGSAHQMASCRMSRDGASYGAVDTKGRLFECSNVHVMDTSVFPSASGVNPMISCMSTAHVLAGFLAEELASARL